MNYLSKKKMIFLKFAPIFTVIKKVLLFIMTWFFKFEIKLLHIVFDNTICYLFYTFLVCYSFYGLDENMERTFTHHLASLIITYLIFSSIFIYLTCKIPFTRKFLDNLITPEYVVKHLGEYTSTRQIVKAVSVITGIGVLEIATEHASHQKMIERRDLMTKSYENIHGHEPEKWGNGTKKDYLNKSNTMLQQRGGLVTDMTKKAHVENISKTIADFLKEMRRR